MASAAVWCMLYSMGIGALGQACGRRGTGVAAAWGRRGTGVGLTWDQA